MQWIYSNMSTVQTADPPVVMRWSCCVAGASASKERLSEADGVQSDDRAHDAVANGVPAKP